MVEFVIVCLLDVLAGWMDKRDVDQHGGITACLVGSGYTNSFLRTGVLVGGSLTFAVVAASATTAFRGIWTREATSGHMNKCHRKNTTKTDSAS